MGPEPRMRPACGCRAVAAWNARARRAPGERAPRAGEASATGSIRCGCAPISAWRRNECCARESSREQWTTSWTSNAAPSNAALSNEAILISSGRDGGWHASWRAPNAAAGRDRPRTCGPAFSDALPSLNPLGRPPSPLLGLASLRPTSRKDSTKTLSVDARIFWSRQARCVWHDTY